MTTKDKVKKYLFDREGSFVSGQDLAQSLGISRAAIWKAVDSLRREGLDIEAQTKKGYRLKQLNPPLDKTIIRNALIDPIKNIDLYLYDSLDSTNTQAARLDQDLDLGNMTCLLAEEQTQGRGRSGKSFDSPKGTGLYMSVVLKPQESHEMNLDLLTIKACVAVYEAIKKLSPDPLQIKWVNDLYLGQKKIAGILAEGSFKEARLQRVIVGIGLNVFTQEDQFDPNIKERTSSLFPKDLGRSEIGALILNKIYQVFYKFSNSQVLEIYKENNLVLGREVTFSLQDIEYRGIAKDINEKGNLIVQVGNQEIALSSGQISLGSW